MGAKHLQILEHPPHERVQRDRVTPRPRRKIGATIRTGAEGGETIAAEDDIATDTLHGNRNRRNAQTDRTLELARLGAVVGVDDIAHFQTL